MKNKLLNFIFLLLFCISPNIGAQQTVIADDGWKRELPDRTVSRLQGYEEEARLNPPPQEAVVFAGSATPSGWDLDRWFPEFTTLKRAYGGSMIDENTYLAKRAVIPHNPSTIVLYAGENDIHLGKTPELTLQHFKEYVATIKIALPNTQLIYITMKPSILWWDDYEDMKVANALIESYISGEDYVYFVDTFKLMIDQNGEPRRDYLGGDDLHLTDLGYEVWTAAVSPVIKAAESNYQMLKRISNAH